MTLKSLITFWLALELLLSIEQAYSENEQQWIGSWYASPTSFIPASDNVTLQKAFTAGYSKNKASMQAPPMELVSSFSNSTLRSIVRLTAGGDRLRLRFSNQYGKTSLKIGAVRVTANEISEKVTFGGKDEVTVPAGAGAISDTVSLRTTAGSELTVSVFYPESIPNEITLHFNMADSRANGLTLENTLDATISTPTVRALRAVYFLTGVDVESSIYRGTIVAIGDSMTDCGALICWPELLAQQLAEQGKQYGVLNAALGGNRLLRDSKIPYGGESALARFNRDVLDQPSVKYVILYEGINDLAVWFHDGFNSSLMPVKAQEIVKGIEKLAERTHQRGLKFYVATLAPTGGATAHGFDSLEKNKVREEINAWIRTTNAVDGYIDFDRALADPTRPDRQNMELNIGDHLHPNQAGQRALSRAIDLSLFE